MTIAYASGATASDTTGTAVTASLGTTVAGQLIVITIADDSATTTAITGVSDNHGNTWTKVPLARTNNVVQNSVAVQMWYSVLTTGGAGHTVTVTWSLTNTARVTVAAQYFNGFTGTPTYDQNHSATGSTTSANAGSLTVTPAESLIVTGAGHAGTVSAFSLGSGNSNLSTVNAANASVAQESQVQAAGTYSGILTIAAARAWGAAVASFYNATGGQTVSPSGIATAGAFGSTTVTTGAVTVSPSGIASAEAFGTPTLGFPPQTVEPSAIASAEAFGTAAFNRAATTIALPAGTVPVRSLTTDEILTGNRYTRFRFDLLDETEAPKGTLDGVQAAGSVVYSSAASVKGKCSLSIVDNGQSINFLTDRVRPVILVEGLPEQPLGVFLFTGAPEAWSDTGRTWSTTLLDKTTIPGQTAPATTYALAAGTVVTDQIVTILTDLGETNIAITPSAATLANPIVWDVSDQAVTWLKIINDLLSYINYFSLYCDGNGQYRGEPYTRPAARPIVWEFLDGPTAIYSPAFTRDVDLYGIPNVFIAVSQGTGETAALVSTATNDDPTSPYSTVNRGTRTQKATGVQIADQATLDAYAQRRLIELTSPTSSVDVMHAYVPGLTFNNAARLRRVPAGIDARHVVSKTEISFDATALVKSSLTEVVDL